ncbi:hypothetical protein PF010_g16792 [Phytophthora fragariae]|uniref:Uncharacterized protein n=1 Tax=Phytophthora fragariae TaxID=53985 RepID=A0A6G0KQP9_9STRA|nr:hypothetical protein PF010_g16792 [Phytophthora fragariae]
MAVKSIQMSISLYDIEQVVQRMRALRKQRGVTKVVAVQEKHRNSSVDANGAVPHKRTGSRISSSPLFALIQASTRNMSRTIHPFNQIHTKPQRSHGLLAAIAPLLAEFIDDDQRGASKDTVDGATASNTVKYRYVRELRRVLYITEFVMLVNYVEVVIPLIFSAYLFAIHHLPNRAYYEMVAEMTTTDFAVHCSILQISAFHQLSFVLEKQWNQVQNQMIVWVFYNVQSSLQHFGSDYTFKVLWLRTNATPSN